MNLANRIETWPLDRLKPYAQNARTHDAAQVAKIAASMAEFGFTNPILVDSADGIIAGHGRLMAARELGLTHAPVIVLDHLSDAQRRAYVLADNRLALDAGWDHAMLAAELEALREDGFDLALTGFSDAELADLLDGDGGGSGDGDGAGSGGLAGKFMIPPFSVLNAREGWWQDRKRAWIGIGIKSELGRGDDAIGYSDACKTGYAQSYSGQDKLNAMMGKPGKKVRVTPGGGGGAWLGSDGQPGAEGMSGTSIFDPVLCEIAYRWFCPSGGVIVDPFAGGSVRGIVAARLGLQYMGGELRAEQVEANRAQADEICGEDPLMPIWHHGDSRNIDKTMAGVQADMVFSCPPYADLEVYSDDPKDLSTLDYAEFRDAYFEIIAKACSLLKNDRFACFVVGEVRDKRGNYYDFVGDTVEAFRRAGLAYYNEAILVTAVGSLPIRAGKQFSASRKMGKTHQNVLVFVKGDGKKAAQACGEVETVDVLADPDGGDAED